VDGCHVLRFEVMLFHVLIIQLLSNIGLGKSTITQ
jgi:hypothetical protein